MVLIMDQKKIQNMTILVMRAIAYIQIKLEPETKSVYKSSCFTYQNKKVLNI